MDDVLISIIFYNEKLNLEKTIKQLSGKKINVLFVDDGSSDNSSCLIPKYLKKNLIQHKKNLGYGSTIKSSINYAYKKKFNYCIIFPGDNQRNSADIQKLYNYIKEKKFDYLVGSKFHLLKNIPIKRKIGNLLFSKLSSIFWENKTKDILSGFKIYDVKKCKDLINECPDDYSFDLIFNYMSNKRKFFFNEIDVFCNYKNQTSQIKNLLLLAFRMVYKLLQYKFKN